MLNKGLLFLSYASLHCRLQPSSDALHNGIGSDQFLADDMAFVQRKISRNVATAHVYILSKYSTGHDIDSILK